ncbi:hypothetical protein [Nocardioides aestuarii]|uniref:ABM domain-containing protein n=1 Tax=Nocardioides aestuarii TaxID=252231 RepID=A0ABW4TM86_9ACTN
MAVMVEFEVRGVTPEQLYEVEQRTTERGEALGRPPYDGLVFLAVSPRDDAFRFVSVWRTEEAFAVALDSMLAPDLAAVGAVVSDVVVGPVMSMAIPGDH